MATIEEVIKAFESLNILVAEHKKLLSDFGKLTWTYTFPGIDDEPELTTKTNNIKSMITDIRDWYDFSGLDQWTLLEQILNNIKKSDTLRISFHREGTKTVFDFNPKSWMVIIKANL